MAASRVRRKTARGEGKSASPDGGVTDPSRVRRKTARGEGKSASPVPRHSVDVGALDQEGDAHVSAVLVEVLPPNSRADDVDGPDVPQRALRLAERLLGRVVGGRLRASNQLDDLDNRHSLLLFVG